MNPFGMEDCWFCGKPVETPDSWKTVSMHREMYRIPTASGSQVTYERTTVSIPCCPKCRGIDKRMEKVIEVEFCCAAALTVVYWLVHFVRELMGDPSGENILASIIGFVLAVGFTWIVPFAIAAIPTWAVLYLQRRRAGLGRWKEFPECKTLLAAGWKPGADPAGVEPTSSRIPFYVPRRRSR